MKILYYDCFAGISGDMNLGAMLDLGVSQKKLESELKKLNLENWKLKVSRDERGGIFGTRVDVLCDTKTHSHASNKKAANSAHAKKHHHHSAHHHHRTWRDIKKIISSSGLSANAKKISLNIFEKIAEAEAKVHGKKIDDVHFHEVGALDSIIDIVGAAVCIDILSPDKICASAVELGGGSVKCAHSIMPVPAPATAEIAKSAENFLTTINGAQHECTTPTGAAIIAALSQGGRPQIEGKIISSGIGIGHRACAELPNFLRVSLIEVSKKSCACEKMYELSANIDDDTPEMLSLLCETLFEVGAVDVWQESIFMKKGRLGVKLCALVSEKSEKRVRRAFLENSTTLGLRRYELDRFSIPRKLEKKKTRYGEVYVKMANADDFNRSDFKVEFDDLKKILKKRAPLSKPAASKKTKVLEESKNFRKIYKELREDIGKKK